MVGTWHLSYDVEILCIFACHLWQWECAYGHAVPGCAGLLLGNGLWGMGMEGAGQLGVCHNWPGFLKPLPLVVD